MDNLYSTKDSSLATSAIAAASRESSIYYGAAQLIVDGKFPVHVWGIFAPVQIHAVKNPGVHV
jgi:hypothetical protein